MTNPFLRVTKLVSTVTNASAHLFVPMFKSTLTPVVAAGRVSSLYTMTEGNQGAQRNPRPRFVYGQVRWVAPRTIIEWHTHQGAAKEKFAIYRGETLNWREARYLDLSIFASSNSQTNLVTYRAVDTTATLPGPYYYWIVNLTARYGEQHFGPYRVAADDGHDS